MGSFFFFSLPLPEFSSFLCFLFLLLASAREFLCQRALITTCMNPIVVPSMSLRSHFNRLLSPKDRVSVEPPYKSPSRSLGRKAQSSSKYSIDICKVKNYEPIKICLERWLGSKRLPPPHKHTDVSCGSQTTVGTEYIGCAANPSPNRPRSPSEFHDDKPPDYTGPELHVFLELKRSKKEDEEGWKVQYAGAEDLKSTLRVAECVEVCEELAIGPQIKENCRIWSRNSPSDGFGCAN